MFDFFKSDDNDEQTEYESDRVRVTSNADITVNRGTVDELDRASDVKFDASWLNGLDVYDISIDDDDGGATTEPSTSDPSGPSVPDHPRDSGPATTTPSSPSTSPTTTPEPDAGPASRGTFVFPNDRDFMQKLEARGLNGHRHRVETVYVLAGPTYTMPAELFRLDSPEYYASATRRSVSFYTQKMAKKIAALYPDDESPKLIARFHTHPGGSTTPSSADKQSAESVHQSFIDAFGTDDFEYFSGIHAYADHGSNPDPDERHDPKEMSNGVAWKGEQFRHELALFGPKFENMRRVTIDDGH